MRVVFLGGLGEIGRNCMAIELGGGPAGDGADRSILLIDCGLMFPDPDMHGIDLVLPDFTYLRENASRIVAVVSARTPTGKDIVVAGGGVPAKAGKRTYRIVLGNQATFLPKGSKLTVTIASSSLAQNPGNLLYLDLPFPSTARLAVTGGSLAVVVTAGPPGSASSARSGSAHLTSRAATGTTRR